VTVETPDRFGWVNDKLSEIRANSDRTVAKIEELTRDPALEREAREKFPDDPYILKILHWAMENERILARHGVFIDYVDPFGEL
jgi:hypothetical protein